jgi:hypothetical protein
MAQGAAPSPAIDGLLALRRSRERGSPPWERDPSRMHRRGSIVVRFGFYSVGRKWLSEAA